MCGAQLFAALAIAAVQEVATESFDEAGAAVDDAACGCGGGGAAGGPWWGCSSRWCRHLAEHPLGERPF